MVGKGIQLFRDWFVFFSFIYLFDSLRGSIYILTCKLNLPVYVIYVINLEKKLFGEIPSVFLQKVLLNPDALTWFEKSLTVSTAHILWLFCLSGYSYGCTNPTFSWNLKALFIG